VIELKKSIAWGITGSGDKIVEIVETMKRLKIEYEDSIEIRVYLSKAGEQVIKYYGLVDVLENEFKIRTEIDANTPFLAGQLQMGRFEFFLIAPATSNTVAKISLGIGDSLISNSAIMAAKAFIPVYILPSDLEEGVISTRLPSGKNLEIRIRSEDVENVKRLSMMTDIFVLRDLLELPEIFNKNFG
jgi:archaeoflavoprotein AfpA